METKHTENYEEQSYSLGNGRTDTHAGNGHADIYNGNGAHSPVERKMVSRLQDAVDDQLSTKGNRNRLCCCQRYQ